MYYTRYFTALLLLFSHIITSAQIVKSYPDNSLTLANYAEIGIPQPDKIWTVTDYKVAFKYLKELHKEDREGLPRKESSLSGDLFNRMVNIDNFQFMLDQSQPLQERFKSLEYIVNVPNELYMLYVEPSDSVQRNGIEVLSIVFFSMENNLLAFEFVDQIITALPHLKKNDDFMIMYESIQESIGKSILKNIELIEKDYRTYDHKVLTQFTNMIVDWLPKVKSQINATQKQEILTHTKSIKKTHPNKSVRGLMKHFKKILG